MYKLLKYIENHCLKTFASCFFRNGNIKTEVRKADKRSTVTLSDGLFQHGVDVYFKQMGCKILFMLG